MPNMFIVSDFTTYPNGKPTVGVKVCAYDKDMRSEQAIEKEQMRVAIARKIIPINPVDACVPSSDIIFLKKYVPVCSVL